MDFAPDYTNIQNAAFNRPSKRLPLYEHIITDSIMEKITGKNFRHLFGGDYKDKVEYFRNFCDFHVQMGYDSLSFECCIGGAMPDSGCLGGHKESVIKNRADFEKYPWDEVPEIYFNKFGDYFKALGEALPDGMKAVGGVGNGIFECVQDVIGYTNLCYFSADDPELYEDFFKRVGEMSLKIWERFMREYSDMYCVLRFGDDMGFKTNTLIPADDIKKHIIPEYAKIIECVHRYNKPFLLHSCGHIFNVMPELIEIAKIDAKHSNEDQIAYFPEWVKKYGNKIGNFGGIDTDAVCRLSPVEMKEYIYDVLNKSKPFGGVNAFGSGNSIPDYVPVDGYLAMVNTVRRYRGEKI